MDYNQFNNLLNLKDIRNKDAVPMLEELIEKYPYFPTARVLLAKALHEQQSIHYEEALKISPPRPSCFSGGRISLLWVVPDSRASAMSWIVC
jgi:hypothetical protein